jgi:Helix-turn-helix domain
MAELDPVPDLLTLEEAARVLRIGRTAAYAQARVARETDGRAGIPNIAIGGQYRVPRGALERC